MTVVAGIDVGNHTTEIVLARVHGGTALPIAHAETHTQGRKGSRSSIEGAVALLQRLEVETGILADALALSAIRPTDTATAAIPPTAVDCSPVRSLRRRTASTPAGAGHGVGRLVPLSKLSGEVNRCATIVAVGEATDFEDAAHQISEAVARGWNVVGVVVEQDDAVLIHNRIPIDVPVVDEVDLDGLEPGALVGVEVVTEGRAYRALADPIALTAALGLPQDQLRQVAEFTRELNDSPAIAVTRRTGPVPVPAPDGDYVDCTVEGAVVRYTPGQALTFLRSNPPGAAVRVCLGAVPGTAGGLDVDDAYFTDLSSIDSGAWLRRGVIEAHGSVVALLTADPVTAAEATFQQLTGRPARTVATEPDAAARGARTTPGMPEDSIVCDIGGGTIDLIGDHKSVTAAGAGETITAGVAHAIGIPRALAERVKRTPCVRVENPHIAHEEDGRRVFLESPAQVDAIGRLCTRGDAGLVPFSTTLAAEEWRSLRLAIKQETVAANIARCLTVFDQMPSALVLAGGGALDDELVRAVGESLRRTSVVGRANIDGRHGPRYAVASGLVHLFAAEGTKPSGSQDV